MNAGEPLVTGAGWVAVAAYFWVLLGVALASRRARRDDSLADFYLAGRSFGPVVTFLTFYATQYSGLTLIGFAGKAYRQGFSFLVASTFGCAVVGGYLMLAPRLQALSVKRGYVTVGDFVHDRYGSLALTWAGTAVFVFALAAYILSNLKAMGYVVHAATGGQVTAAQGIAALSLLMVAYETFGGLRAVAWTDVIQGAILMLGCVAIFVAMGLFYGGPSENGPLLLAHSPAKWQPPSLEGKVGWVSVTLLVGAGASIYPHAIQRIYAARDAQALRRSFSLMLLAPFLTTLLMLLVGLADREARGLADGETLMLGRRTVRWLDTPHLPHGWDCGYLFEETTRTLLCGDMFTQPGDRHEPITTGDIVNPSEAMRGQVDYFAHSPDTGALISKLAATSPEVLACMHGASYRGDGAAQLKELSARLVG